MSIGQKVIRSLDIFTNSVPTEVKNMLESVLRKGVLNRLKDTKEKVQ